jgi:extracellular factor (EF) 3-hydroxypalmitic acid methyl ester biosynthesis protein
VETSNEVEWRGLFDGVYDSLAGPVDEDRVGRGISELVVGLRRLYDALPADDWRQCIAAARRHRLVHLVHQDPFTCRSYWKPRGYAGDARMLDYIYGYLDEDEHVTALGRVIMQHAVNSQASRAVRRRREILAEYVSAVAQATPAARVLSVASGYLREAHLLDDPVRVADFVAVDQDLRSIAKTNEMFGARGVRALPWSVRDLIAGRRRDALGTFDLVYAAGLYDYLPDPVACRLTTELFGMLRPGGTLLIANFLPSIDDVGYMETYMDWRLLYRTPPAMSALVSDIAPESIGGVRVFVEEHGAIVFAEVTRR